MVSTGCLEFGNATEYSLIYLLVVAKSRCYTSFAFFFNKQNLKEIAGKVFIDAEPEICPPEVRCIHLIRNYIYVQKIEFLQVVKES